MGEAEGEELKAQLKQTCGDGQQSAAGAAGSRPEQLIINKCAKQSQNGSAADQLEGSYPVPSHAVLSYIAHLS